MGRLARSSHTPHHSLVVRLTTKGLSCLREGLGLWPFNNLIGRSHFSKAVVPNNLKCVEYTYLISLTILLLLSKRPSANNATAYQKQYEELLQVGVVVVVDDEPSVPSGSSGPRNPSTAL